MRSTDAGEEKGGTGGRASGDWSRDGGAFSLLLLGCEFISCTGYDDVKERVGVSKD